MDILPQPHPEINRADLRVFIDWRGNLATGAGAARRLATAIDLLKAPRPTRRATGYRDGEVSQ